MNKKKMDYKPLFFMGISFVGVGVVFMASVNPAIGIACITVGIVNMLVGAKHKNTWKK